MPDFENKMMPPKIIEKVRKQSRKNKLRFCEGQNPQIKEVFKFCFQSTETFCLSEADFFFFNSLEVKTAQVLPLTWVELKLSSQNDLYIGRWHVRPFLGTYTRHIMYYNTSGMMAWKGWQWVKLWLLFGLTLGCQGLIFPSWTSCFDMVPTSHLTLAPSNPLLCEATAIALPRFLSNQIVNSDSDGFVWMDKPSHQATFKIIGSTYCLHCGFMTLLTIYYINLMVLALQLVL